MKVLVIDTELYLYPSQFNSLDEFVESINSNNSFIKMKKLVEKNCVSPFYVFEEIIDVYINASNATEISEDEAVLMNREDYDNQIKKICLNTCPNCVDFDNCCKGKAQEYREKLCLNGTCWGYCEE